MKNIKIILPILALLIVGATVYVYMDIQEQDRLAEEKIKAEQAVAQQKLAQEQAIQARTKCNKAENFFVVTMDRENAVGQDILVKENASNVDMSCKYVVDGSDFELKNSDPQYFKGLEKKALVTDVGTGPSGRMLRIYDMTDKSLVTEKKYFGDITVASGTLTYFGLAKAKADAKNCKEYKTLMADFGNANLVVEKQVNLETFLVKETKNTKCVAEQ